MYNIRKNGTRLEKLTAAQRGTITDIEEMLEKHQIALMVRPTGFGKTHLLIDLCKKERYSKVLYIYPTNVIKQSIFESYHNPASGNGIKFTATPEEHLKNKSLPYIEFASYMKMLRDWNAAYKYIGNKNWDERSASEKDSIERSWESMAPENRLKMQREWLSNKLADIELLILDEAHTVGANGFLSYWPYIKELATNGSKFNRLHVVGATATPLRTDPKIDIERDVFSYVRAGKVHSARIPDFTAVDCWRMGIMPTPYYTKGVIDKENQIETLTKALYSSILGESSFAHQGAKRGRKSTKATEVININNQFVDRHYKIYEAERERLEESFATLKQPSDLIRDAVLMVAKEKVANSKYLRFLIFYQNTEDMAMYHKKITEAFKVAFDIAPGNAYSKLNVHYLATSKATSEMFNLPQSDISVISKRDAEIKAHPERGIYNIDLIHSIDILNMGYHVGNVTGVVIKRATTSEIKYYQQIGRCMSITEDSTPLIIDFANADAELFRNSYDTLRDEAAERIQEFISGCTQSDDCEQLNQIYSSINMHVATDRVDDALLDYWYFDRKAPIYFIKGIAESMKCNESLESLVTRIRKIAITKYNQETIELDDFVLRDSRINKKLIGTQDSPGVLIRELSLREHTSEEV